jgi:iron-sulfur cluster repair protein YtfE (RIC family)
MVRARMVKFLREEEQILFPMLEASAGARFPERRDLRVRLVR